MSLPVRICARAFTVRPKFYVLLFYEILGLKVLKKEVLNFLKMFQNLFDTLHQKENQRLKKQFLTETLKQHILYDIFTIISII